MRKVDVFVIHHNLLLLLLFLFGFILRDFAVFLLMDKTALSFHSVQIVNMSIVLYHFRIYKIDLATIFILFFALKLLLSMVFLTFNQKFIWIEEIKFVNSTWIPTTKGPHLLERLRFWLITLCRRCLYVTLLHYLSSGNN